jgi:enamine deaminase RidA (YjgF/YER057c/UK114 family)
MTPSIRTSIASGDPLADEYGYARAVRVADQIVVSGTPARAPHLDGDAVAQLTSAIATVTAALNEAGADLRHVVRSVVYVRDMADARLVARAHRQAFGASPPASTWSRSRR